MKDSEFIELLNLYLDHEISATDAARLEAEVQRDPDRQKIYRQYCRMQKACKLLTADFQPETVPASPGKVVAFDHAAAAVTPRRSTGGIYTVGALTAAAACVALIFVGRNRQAAAEPATLIAGTAAQVAPAVVADASVAARSSDVPVTIVADAAPAPNSGPQSLGGIGRPKLVADPLLLTGSSQADAVLAAAIEQANAQFAWMQNVRLAPIQQPGSTQNLRFDAQPVSWQPDRRALDNRNSAPGATEMSAFQFMK